MKQLFSSMAVVALLTFGSVALAAEAPNLLGTWEGKPQVHGPHMGHKSGKAVVMNITEQQGNVFVGEKWYLKDADKEARTEKFSGTVSSTGAIHMVDHDEGTMLGQYRDGEMELQYGHTGKKAIAAYMVLKKKK